MNVRNILITCLVCTYAHIVFPMEGQENVAQPSSSNQQTIADTVVHKLKKKQHKTNKALRTEIALMRTEIGNLKTSIERLEDSKQVETSKSTSQDNAEKQKTISFSQDMFSAFDYDPSTGRYAFED